MKPSNSCNKALVLALRGAFLTMALLPAAKAADTSNPGQVGSPAAPVTGLDNSNPAIVELTRQQSRLELGLGYVSDDSYKFGEYNGLESQGGYLIGNIDLRGGGRYFDDDTTRWRAQGSNLGLDTRELSAEYGHQGRYRFTVDYDELRRNRSDSYQTPYLGVGSTTLTLPSNWVIPVLPRVNATTANARGLDFDASRSNAIVAGVSTPPTAAQLAVSDALMAADLPAFHHVDLDTKRQRTDLGYSRVLNENWQFKAGYRHEDKNGLKPMGTITRQTGSDISTVLPDVIDQTTEQWDVGFSYTGEKAFLQVGYYGSLFDNNVNSLTWQNWAKSTAPNMNTMSSAPSNQFHQLTLSGGYDITPTAKLVVDAAYGRATQDEPFLMGDATVPVVPQSSADALVVSKAFNIKLTGRPASGLQLSAGYKFDERDNQTPVNTYQFSDANQPLSVLAPFPGGAVVAENANANQPYSKRVHKIDLDADYRLGKGQFIKVGDDYQEIERWCDGSWIDCADAAKTKENTLHLEYRNSVIENLSGRIGYEHGDRTVNAYNENAFLSLVPFANEHPSNAPNLPNGVPATAYNTMLFYGLNGWGPNSGLNPAAPAGSALAYFFSGNNALVNAQYANENRISELPGMRRYNMADRNRDKLRTGLNWQASEQLGLQAGINYNDDDYDNSRYGLKEARAWSINLDANYQVSERFNVSAFYTYEDQHAKSAGNTYTANSSATSVNGFTAISGGCYSDIATRNQNNKIDSCLDWSADLHDRIDTLGVAFLHKGSMSGKLRLLGDISLTRARSDGRFTGGNYVNNPLAVVGAPADTIAAYYIAATPLPTITTRTVDLRLIADYALDKQSSVRLGYLFSRLRSEDWAYDGMQPGGPTQFLPSDETSPKYSVHVVGVSYMHSFR